MSSPHVIIGPDRAATISLAPIATPTHGSGGSLSVACSGRIAAPPETCLAVLLNTAQYVQWNRFVPRVTILKEAPASPAAPAAGPGFLALGTEMEFEVHMDLADKAGRSTQKARVVVSALDRVEEDGRKGWRVAWRTAPGGLLPFALWTERIQDLMDDGEGGTLYVCWETFYGLLTPVVRFVIGKQLEGGFAAWMGGLREQAEKKAVEQKAGQ